MSLAAITSDADVLVALEPNELGLRLLPIIVGMVRIPGDTLSLQSFLALDFGPRVSFPEGRHYIASPFPEERNREVREAVVDAWAWLEGQALITPEIDTYGTPNPTTRRVTRKGISLAKDPRLALAARLLPKEILHRRIREDVWALFHRGEYGTAVFVAMKAVEVWVREASGFAAADLGTDLMRRAFHKDNGPLTDLTALPAERDARSALFSGAIGSYKNPQSHRHVDLDDPNETAEIIMLACHLLRIVDARFSAIGTLAPGFGP